MLRQVIVALGMVAVASQAGLAMAANPDTGPGCGLGKLAWADYKNQKNIAPQVMMATTNGTFTRMDDATPEELAVVTEVNEDGNDEEEDEDRDAPMGDDDDE